MAASKRFLATRDGRLLKRSPDGVFRQFCGGTLIHQDWLLDLTTPIRLKVIASVDTRLKVKDYGLRIDAMTGGGNHSNWRFEQRGSCAAP